MASEPRVWALPDQPGPDVRAVRDYRGDVWTRATALQWVLRDDPEVGADWRSLVIQLSPLTEVTVRKDYPESVLEAMATEEANRDEA